MKRRLSHNSSVVGQGSQAEYMHPSVFAGTSLCYRRYYWVKTVRTTYCVCMKAEPGIGPKPTVLLAAALLYISIGYAL